ncbi:MAG: hypothetical protein ABI699_09740 [Caldimonas sp.]
MASILFSSIADASEVGFNPLSDVLTFDNGSISAASLILTYASDFTAIGIKAGGTSFTLTSTVKLTQLTTTNVRFADGSQLVIGDNSTGANDSAANNVVGGIRNDQLFGLAGHDTLRGGAGDDTYVDPGIDTIVESGEEVELLLVSRDSVGGPGNDDSFSGELSPDNRYLLFLSDATNLVADDNNGVTDVFLKDLQTGAVSRVSTDSSGAQANGFSFSASFSPDGRYVVFSSWANNLVAADTNDAYDVFMRDLQTGTVTRVSTDASNAQANGNSSGGVLSAGAGYLVFSSQARNLVAGDTNFSSDVFVKDLQSGAIRLVSSAANGTQGESDSFAGSLSADGRYVIFESASRNLVPEPPGHHSDSFLKDLQTGAIQRISSYGTEASLSPDGRYAAFISLGDLVPGDTNGKWDVYLKNLGAGSFQRVGTDTNGTQGNENATVVRPAFSPDGRYLAFSTYASNLAPGDDNGSSDVFIKDLQSGELQVVSIDSEGTVGNGPSVIFRFRFSPDGRYLIFDSVASNFVAGDDNVVSDVFMALNPFLAGGLDTVRSNTSYTLQANLENLVLTGIGAIDAIGNGLDNILYSGTGDNLLDGNGGHDTASYLYAPGAVTVSLAVLGTAQATGGSGTDTLLSIESLVGSDFGDTLAGGAGDDVLDGGAGADLMRGGSGSDIYRVDDARDVISETAAGGTDVVISTVSFTLNDNVEFLTLDGTAAIDGTGNALKNTLIGNAAANVLDGGAGGDRMAGGDGSDTYVVDSAGDVVTESNADPATGGIDTIVSTFNYTLGTNVENLRLVGAGPLRGTGNALGNVLHSGAGNNVLDGGAGRDTASYLYAGSAVSVSLVGQNVAQATGGSGSDTLLSIEGLAGSDFNDTLTGNAGANTLDGGRGADLMIGGDGSDTYVVDNAGDVVSETNAARIGGVDAVLSYMDYALGSNLENLRLMGAGAIDGTGNGLDNVLYSGIGSNVLDGAVGSDTASYLYANSAVTVSLAIAGAQATGGSGNDTLIDIENLAGSAFDDTLIGNAGDNILDGHGGADSMTGGEGSDTYVVTDMDDVVTESEADPANGGVDTINTSLDRYFLDANVENLRVVAAEGIHVIGNGLDNILYSGAGGDRLDGYYGNDTASYQYAASAVAVVLSTWASQSTGGSGRESLFSIESLIGSAFDDTLGGNRLDNTLDGGTGADRLTGRNGSDTYIVDNPGDVVAETEATASIGGVDTVLSSIAYTLGANVENLRLTVAGAVNGTGNELSNVLYAGAGDNVLDGGGGTDTASYRYAEAAVTVTLETGAAQATGGSGSDTLIRIESLTGSGFDDQLRGNSAHNVINGGRGNDLLTGAGGSDTFFFSTDFDGITNVDAITDFVSGDDRISLGQDKFSAAGPVGVLADSVFVLGTEAADDSDRIVYDQTTGKLYYDADGNGEGAQLLFATLLPGTVIAPGDLWLG